MPQEKGLKKKNLKILPPPPFQRLSTKKQPNKKSQTQQQHNRDPEHFAAE